MNLPSLVLVVVLPGCKCLWLICVRCTSVLCWPVILWIILLGIVVLILVWRIPIVILFVKWALGLVIGVLWGLEWLSWCKLPGWLTVVIKIRSRGVIWLLVIPLLIVVVIRSICWWRSVVWYWSSVIWEVS